MNNSYNCIEQKDRYGDFTVLMSVYFKENPDYLRLSLESIYNQVLKPRQIVIVKDGPLTSELDLVLNQFYNRDDSIECKIHSLPENAGLGKALQFGLQFCTYEIVARADSDDICFSNRFHEQVSFLKEHSDIKLLGSSIKEFKFDPTIVTSSKKMPIEHKDIVKYSKYRNPFNHPSVVFYKQVVYDAGGYRHFPYYEDYDLWIRIILKGYKVANIEESLVLMRANDGLYKRRGGLSYIKKIVNFRLYMLKIKYINLFVFIYTTTMQCLIALFPNGLRRIVYTKILRQKG
jgi:glycosyltransferase involved in cell wall biosynthesis